MRASLRVLIAALVVGLGLTAGARDASAAGEPGCAIFPPDNAWNQDISGLPVHPQSDVFVDSIGRTEYLHPDFGTVWNGRRSAFPT